MGFTAVAQRATSKTRYAERGTADARKCELYFNRAFYERMRQKCDEYNARRAPGEAKLSLSSWFERVGSESLEEDER